MRHFEVVFLVHPDQSEQVPATIDRYQKLIKSKGGRVHRLEDWGRRQLAYPINKLHKAHYILMNIECDKATLQEITDSFRFNDAILRHLVLRRDEAIAGPSVMAKTKDEKVAHKSEDVRSDSSSVEEIERITTESIKEEMSTEAH